MAQQHPREIGGAGKFRVALMARVGTTLARIETDLRFLLESVLRFGVRPTSNVAPRPSGQFPDLDSVEREYRFLQKVAAATPVEPFPLRDSSAAPTTPAVIPARPLSESRRYVGH